MSSSGVAFGAGAAEHVIGVACAAGGIHSAVRPARDESEGAVVTRPRKVGGHTQPVVVVSCAIAGVDDGGAGGGGGNTGDRDDGGGGSLAFAELLVAAEICCAAGGACGCQATTASTSCCVSAVPVSKCPAEPGCCCSVRSLYSKTSRKTMHPRTATML